MATKRVHDYSDTMNWTNDTGSDVAKDSVVEFVNSIAIAQDAIADTESGIIFFDGVWRIAKESGTAFNQGDKIFWDSAASEMNADTAEKYAGIVWKDAAAGDTTVDVALNKGYQDTDT